MFMKDLVHAPLTPRWDIPALRRLLLERLKIGRQRRALSKLDEHLLNDIGITPEQARHEAEKPFWF